MTLCWINKRNWKRIQMKGETKIQKFTLQAKISVFAFWKRTSWNSCKINLELETMLDNVSMKCTTKLAQSMVLFRMSSYTGPPSRSLNTSRQTSSCISTAYQNKILCEQILSDPEMPRLRFHHRSARKVNQYSVIAQARISA
jgi:hypothetical protein